MQYQLIKSNRKTIAISFDRDGNLIVKAPLWLSAEEIEDFVAGKEEWILATAARLKRAREKSMAERLRLENGDILNYLGEKRILSVIREQRSRGKVKCVMERLLLWVPYEADYEYKREQLEKWYRKQALLVFTQKAEEFAEILNVSFSGIHIKDQKSRWGSCSGRGNLNFNWRLIMAPEPVCDYVIIHELCHLCFMDHSSAFWKLVESVCPHYKQYRNWLKECGGELYII